MALLNNRKKSDLAVVRVTDISTDAEAVRAALDDLEPPPENRSPFDPRLPQPGALRPAAEVSIAEGVQRTFVPERDDHLHAAKLQQLLDSPLLHSKLGLEIQSELHAVGPAPDLPNLYRFQGPNLPIRHLGRIGHGFEEYLVSPRPAQARSLTWDPTTPRARRQVEMQAFFASDGDWEIDLKPFELRQIVLHVNHEAPCLLKVDHIAKFEGGIEEKIDTFFLLVLDPPPPEPA
jgi:hypothetical protein